MSAAGPERSSAADPERRTRAAARTADGRSRTQARPRTRRPGRPAHASRRAGNRPRLGEQAGLADAGTAFDDGQPTTAAPRRVGQCLQRRDLAFALKQQDGGFRPKEGHSPAPSRPIRRSPQIGQSRDGSGLPAARPPPSDPSPASTTSSATHRSAGHADRTPPREDGRTPRPAFAAALTAGPRAARRFAPIAADPQGTRRASRRRRRHDTQPDPGDPAGRRARSRSRLRPRVPTVSVSHNAQRRSTAPTSCSLSHAR